MNDTPETVTTVSENVQAVLRSGELSLLSDEDIELFHEGSHLHLYEKMGAHPMTVDGVAGTYFAVWAPHAKMVSVVGDFNSWNRTSNPLYARGTSGIWEGFVADVGKGTLYKYFIASRYDGYHIEKSDPFMFVSEVPPLNASVIWELGYPWGDQAWMATRHARHTLHAPMSIYE
ncbi:MAG: 1,4-alpha-glucan branching enzyme, partial [Chloroflexaceae bacterium]|nr:1,4-alpha-glucan branching enzyme [Chloroflexaceae bacterium]